MSSMKRPWLQWLFRAYLRRKLSRAFADVRLHGSEHLLSACEHGGALIVCNHVAWWDPLVLIQLDARLGTDGYCLMDEANLRQFSFFGWMGALPLDRSSRTRAFRDLKAATQILERPGRLLAIFAQGEQVPAHLPLEFKEGAAWCALRGPVQVVPLALRYDFGEGPRATVRLSAGEPLVPLEGENAGQLSRRLEAAVGQELDKIDQSIVNSASDWPSGSLIGRKGDTEAAERRGMGVRVLQLAERKKGQ